MRISQENENSQRQTGIEPSPQTRQKASNYRLIPGKFPKQIRLRTKKEYQYLTRTGTRIFGNLIVMDYRIGLHSTTKLGITVSKKYGKAHMRNRFKRVIREAYRSSYAEIPPYLEVNIFPRLPATKISRDAIVSELRTLLSKIV